MAAPFGSLPAGCTAAPLNASLPWLLNASIEPHVLATRTSLQQLAADQASSASKAQARAHLRLGQRLWQREAVSVVAIGGSMMAGMGCTERDYDSDDPKALA